MAGLSSSHRVHTYCALCIARCGAIAVVENGPLHAPRARSRTPDRPSALRQGPRRTRTRLPPGRADPTVPPHPPERRSRSGMGADRLGCGSGRDRCRDASRCGTAGAAGGRLHTIVPIHHRDRGFHRLHPAAGQCPWHPERGYHARRSRLAARFRHSLYLWCGQCRGRRRGAMPDIANSGCTILWEYNPAIPVSRTRPQSSRR